MVATPGQYQGFRRYIGNFNAVNSASDCSNKYALKNILGSGIQHFPSVPSVSTWMPDHYVADWLTEDIAEFRKITKFEGK